jgi:hypothetical protein
MRMSMRMYYQSEHFLIDELQPKFKGDDRNYVIVSRVTGRAIVDRDKRLLKMTYSECVKMIEQIEKIYHYFNE